MSCEKTGCWISLPEYRAFVYGDLHKVDGTLVARVTNPSLTSVVPPIEDTWATFHNVGMWVDRSSPNYGTIIAENGVQHFGLQRNHNTGEYEVYAK